MWLSELDADSAGGLVEKYRDSNVAVHHQDALEVGSNPLFDQGVSFSRIIANPPYGAYLTPERRRQLQSQFPKLYVRDTYGVILYHALNLLESSGRLVFIVPDTFLWLNRHEFLRRRILETTTIEEIALFPSNFFPNVKFGYSGLCIISITNNAPSGDHAFQLLTDFPCVKALATCVDARSDWDCKVSTFLQSEVTSRKNCNFYISNDAIDVSHRASESLGDHAEVRTGFYSGNDVRWVRRKNSAVSRSKKFSDVDFDSIATDAPSLDGFRGKKHFMPIVRGGAMAYHKPTYWYVDWSCDAVAEYRRKGKNPARFQNSSFYFRDGIGVPMVASTRLTGALLEKRLFDQGIVAVFPTSSKFLYYILGFLNSSIATKLIRQINPTANNSANYLKRLPFVIPTCDEIAFIDPIVKLATSQSCSAMQVDKSLADKIDSFYESVWLGLANTVERSGELERD